MTNKDKGAIGCQEGIVEKVVVEMNSSATSVSSRAVLKLKIGSQRSVVPLPVLCKGLNKEVLFGHIFLKQIHVGSVKSRH